MKDSELNGSTLPNLICWLGYEMDDRGSIPGKGRKGIVSLHHLVQTCSEVHPVSCPMGTEGSLPGGKAAGAWNWSLTSI